MVVAIVVFYSGMEIIGKVDENSLHLFKNWEYDEDNPALLEIVNPKKVVPQMQVHNKGGQQVQTITGILMPLSVMASEDDSIIVDLTQVVTFKEANLDAEKYYLQQISGLHLASNIVN